MTAHPPRQYDKAHDSDRHHVVLEEVRAGVKEEQTTRMLWMRQKKTWTVWEDVVGETLANQVHGPSCLWSYLAQQISMWWARVILYNVFWALVKVHSSKSLAAAQQPRGKAATTGDTNSCKSHL